MERSDHDPEGNLVQTDLYRGSLCDGKGTRIDRTMKTRESGQPYQATREVLINRANKG